MAHIACLLDNFVLKTLPEKEPSKTSQLQSSSHQKGCSKAGDTVGLAGWSYKESEAGHTFLFYLCTHTLPKHAESCVSTVMGFGNSANSQGLCTNYKSHAYLLEHYF